MGSSMFRAGVSACVMLVLLAARTAGALESEGFGATRTEAKQHAAADLVSNIQVRVRHVVESCKQTVGRRAEDCGSRVLRHSVADLPLLGVRYVEIPGQGEPFGARAVLDPSTALPLYRVKLKELQGEFAASAKALEAASGGLQRYELLRRQLACVRSWQDHRLVSVALGDPDQEAIARETELQVQMEIFERGVDSIALAARVLLQEVPGKLLNVDPLIMAGAEEITPFAQEMSKALLAEGGARTGRLMAAKGDYRIQDDGSVVVTLELRQVPEADLLSVSRVTLLDHCGPSLWHRASTR